MLPLELTWVVEETTVVGSIDKLQWYIESGKACAEWSKFCQQNVEEFDQLFPRLTEYDKVRMERILRGEEPSF